MVKSHKAGAAAVAVQSIAKGIVQSAQPHLAVKNLLRLPLYLLSHILSHTQYQKLTSAHTHETHTQKQRRKQQRVTNSAHTVLLFARCPVSLSSSPCGCATEW